MHREYIRIAEKGELAVLMIHGIVGSPAHFKEFIPLVPQTVSVYNLLLDGHGSSVKDFSKTSMAKWKQQINSTLDEILSRHKAVFILAHSMGTLFAIDAALEHRERVKYLFLLSVPLAPRVTFKAILAAVRLALGIAGEDDATAKAMKADTSVKLERNLFKYLGWVPRYLELFGLIAETKKKLGNITAPGSCYQTAKDELVGRKTGKMLRERTSLRCFTLENSGHFAYSTEDM